MLKTKQHQVWCILSSLCVLIAPMELHLSADALTAKLIHNSTTAINSSLSSATNDILEIPTPHWSCYNDTFPEITARPYLVTAEKDGVHCELPGAPETQADDAQVAEPYIVVFIQGKLFFEWTCGDIRLMCNKQPRCVGIILVMDMSRNAAGWNAHAVWKAAHFEAFPDYQVPEVVMVGASEISGGDPTNQTWLETHSEAGDVLITIRRGDFNDAAVVLQSWPWKLCNYLALLQSLWNAALCAIKVIAYSRGPCKDIPIAIMGVLIPEMVAGILRLMFFLNWAAFEMQLYPWTLLRLQISIPITLGVASTASLASIVYRSHQNASNPHYRKTRSYRCFRCFAFFITFVITFDAIHVVIISQTGATVFPGFMMGLYTLLQIPVSVLFSRFGGATAKVLMSTISAKFTPNEIKRRARFGRKVKLSGLAMLANTIASLGFMFVSDSLTSGQWLWGFFAIHQSLNIISLLQVMAIRTPTPGGENGSKVPSNPISSNKAPSTTRGPKILAQLAGDASRKVKQAWK